MDELKKSNTAQVRATAYSLMQPTDWMVIRKVERNLDVPEMIATYRAAVVAECVRLVAAVEAATDVDGLIAALVANWPAL